MVPFYRWDSTATKNKLASHFRLTFSVASHFQCRIFKLEILSQCNMTQDQFSLTFFTGYFIFEKKFQMKHKGSISFPKKRVFICQYCINIQI